MHEIDGEILVLLIAGVALGFDWIYSIVSRPDSSVLGMSSGGEALGQHAETGGPESIFLVAWQNNEDGIVYRGGRKLRLRIRHPGIGRFREVGTIAFVGPDDRIQVVVAGDKRELCFEVERMRPLKTWVFRIAGDPGICELEISLEIPTRSILRGWLERINEKTFHYSSIEYHRYIGRLMGGELRIDTKAPVSAGFMRSVVPMALLGGIGYYYFIAEARGSYEGRILSESASFLLSGWSHLLAGLIYLAALLAIYNIARSEDIPIAQGYQIPTELSDLSPASSREES